VIREARVRRLGSGTLVQCGRKRLNLSLSSDVFRFNQYRNKKERECGRHRHNNGSY